MNLTPANLTKRYGYWLANVILCELLLTITFAEKSSSKSGAVPACGQTDIMRIWIDLR
jgi:hypothetical protein